MALDITGSMSESLGGDIKINALKKAFALFADQVIPDRPIGGYSARIGLAPYSYSINLGAYASAASNNRSLDGCVTERASGQFNDNTDRFYVAADGKRNVDPTSGGANYQCLSSRLSPLSSDKDALERAVNAYTADGSTGGHFGIQWAWNLVSDNWAGVWGGTSAPASYSEVTKGKLIKAVVLMTDGEFNTAYHGGKSSDQAIALCTAMKKKGIVVFSVVLGNEPEAMKTLQSCATPGAGYFVNATNPQELQAAFSNFATKLTQLRISQ
jgi:hypothetical protein